MITVVGPSNISSCANTLGIDEHRIIDIALETGSLLAKQDYSLIAVPYKGVGYFASKAYLESGGRFLYGILPKNIKSELSCKEIIIADDWIRQPEMLVSRANIMIVIGLSPGTLVEICLTKRYKKYPILIFNNTISAIPKEVEAELNIYYVSNTYELIKKINSF